MKELVGVSGCGVGLEENRQKELKSKESETMKSKRWRRFKISYDVLKEGLEAFQRKLQDVCG